MSDYPATPLRPVQVLSTTKGRPGVLPPARLFVVVTGWSAARISWPRCRALDSSGGGSGLLVDEELARAIRSESVLAVSYWWGAGKETVPRWRRVLGVERLNEGSARLRHSLNQEIGEGLRGIKLSPDQVERRRQTAWWKACQAARAVGMLSLSRGR